MAVGLYDTKVIVAALYDRWTDNTSPVPAPEKKEASEDRRAARGAGL
jgi:hypothetical protein